MILETSRIGDDARKQARCDVAGKLGSQVVCEIENHVGAGCSRRIRICAVERVFHRRMVVKTHACGRARQNLARVGQTGTGRRVDAYE